MSRKKLVLIISLIVSVIAIAGGIVYAQKASAPDANVFQALLEAEDSQDPQDRHFSLFFDGGAYLGVSTEDVSKENMTRYGMRDVRGVGVTEVMKNSPAEKAGLRKDDVILRFDGESVTSVRKLTRLVSESSADQTVRVTISRGGAEQEVSVTLSKRDFNGLLRAKIGDDVWTNLAKDFPYKIEMGNLGKLGDGTFVFPFGNRRIGVSTQSLSKQLAEYFGVKDGGALITSVTENSPAAKAGLKAGDVITAIDGEPVTSPGDITRVLSQKETGDVTLTVIRDKSMRTVTVTPEKNEHPNIFRTGKLGDIRIELPSIEVPNVNIKTPRIVTPSIDVTVPARAPKTRKVII